MYSMFWNEGKLKIVSHTVLGMGEKSVFPQFVRDSKVQCQEDQVYICKELDVKP